MTRPSVPNIPHLPLPVISNKERVLLDDVFDAIFCINLDRRTDRWKRVREIFLALGMKQVRRIVAVDGSALEGPGATVRACARSHAKAHEEALGLGLGRVLVLEDDFAITPHFHPTLAGIASVKVEWDLLVLGRERGWGSFAYATSPAGSHVMLERLRKEEAPADVVLLFDAPRDLPRSTYGVQLFGHVDDGDSDIVHENSFAIGKAEPSGKPSEEPRPARRMMGGGEVMFRKGQRRGL